jgi:radical SAM protein (TIGR04043 family)
MDALSLKAALLCQGINSGMKTIESERRGGAGPAGICYEICDTIVNLPTNERITDSSPFKLNDDAGLKIEFEEESFLIKPIPKPNYYSKNASDGTPMKKIALLHGRDCLATTLYQGCVLIAKGEGCGFCAIKTSLQNGKTILKKTPEQLAETAAESIGDGVKHVTITTGTPSLRDHGASILAETVSHLKETLDLPIHVQLSPPKNGFLEIIFDAGADTIGIHIETFDREVLERVCPGKTEFDYKSSFESAISLFGENQVSSFVIGGLGEDINAMRLGFEELAHQGVIPFLVPFRPLQGTRLELHYPPDPHYMRKLYVILSEYLTMYGVDIDKNYAGCVRCGACSALDVAMKSKE